MLGSAISPAVAQSSCTVARTTRPHWANVHSLRLGAVVASIAPSLVLDPEDRVLGSDPGQLLVGGLGPDAAEELVDLPLPLLQVCAQKGGALLVRQLGRRELLGTAAQHEPAAARDP